MIGGRGMDDVHDSLTGHMARDAIIGRPLLEPGLVRERAGLVGVAIQTAIAVKRLTLAGLGRLMGVVARDAAQPSLARGMAAAFTHLLDLSDKAIAPRPLGRHKDGPETLKRLPRPKILVTLAQARDPPRAAQMTLLANGVAEGRLELGRIDDRVVSPVDQRWT